MNDLLVERNRGERAAAIMRDPLVAEALEEIRTSYIEGWSNSGPQDADVRERAYHMLQAHDAFVRHFQSVIETGEMAAQQLDGAQ
jgi:hypothetical protein